VSRHVVPEQRAVQARARGGVPSRLTDDFLESYLCWREESGAVRQAYVLWEDAARPDRAVAFAAYGAALDREETAARVLSECIERVRNRLR
jgi:hypothetical protein